MNRRQFAKVAALLASLFATPSRALAASHGGSDEDGPRPGNVTRLRIGTPQTATLREKNRIALLSGSPAAALDPPDDENNYWAEAIEQDDGFYYRVGSTTIPISEREFRRVVDNPSLYYFSTALQLHVRIERAREGGIASILA
jgi:hypothetical protein